MYLVVHASVGAVVGNALPAPAESFTAGLASHFVLDMLPHGDEALGRIFIDGHHPLLLSFLFVLDAIAGMSIVTIGWFYGIFPNGVGAFLGAVGAMLPDGLSGVSIVTGGRFLPAFYNFHKKNHTLTNLQAPVAVGATLQFITVFVAVSASLAIAFL